MGWNKLGRREELPPENASFRGVHDGFISCSISRSEVLPPIVALVVFAFFAVFVLPLGHAFFDLITFRPNLGCVELVRVGMCEYYGFGPQARVALFDPSSLYF